MHLWPRHFPPHCRLHTTVYNENSKHAYNHNLITSWNLIITSGGQNCCVESVSKIPRHNPTTRSTICVGCHGMLRGKPWQKTWRHNDDTRVSITKTTQQNTPLHISGKKLHVNMFTWFCKLLTPADYMRRLHAHDVCIYRHTHHSMRRRPVSLKLGSAFR